MSRLVGKYILFNHCDSRGLCISDRNAISGNPDNQYPVLRLDYNAPSISHLNFARGVIEAEM